MAMALKAAGRMAAAASSLSLCPASSGFRISAKCFFRRPPLRILVVNAASEDSSSNSVDDAGGSPQASEEPAAPSGLPSPQDPNKKRNRVVALVSAAAAVCLFLANRSVGFGPGLNDLAARAVPYDEALHNGKPTVVEFYADWCEVCREMARDVYTVEEKYKDRVNFVMLNVDNSKWEAELDDFGVEGIPHFAFLDGKGNEEGNIVGKLPKKYLIDNVEALAKGEPDVPHSRAVGKFSDAANRQAPKLVGPRSHG